MYLVVYALKTVRFYIVLEMHSSCLGPFLAYVHMYPNELVFRSRWWFVVMNVYCACMYRET